MNCREVAIQSRTVRCRAYRARAGEAAQSRKTGSAMDEVQTHRRKVKDREIVLAALRDARVIVREYLEPGPRDCEQTINRLLSTLDDQKVVTAIDRLDRRYSMRIVAET